MSFAFRLQLVGVFAFLFVSQNGFSQGDSYSTNALLFSQTNTYGSARTLGLAGAQTALGADLGSLSSNPAGLGFYRKSEWAVNPQFLVPSSTSTADARNSYDDKKINFVINNFGVAICGLRDDLVESKWRGGTFALGFSRVANFNNTFSYQYDNANSSFADYLVLNANGNYNSNDYNKSNIRTLDDLAYGSYVINPAPIYENGSVTGYYSDSFINLLPNSATVRQKETVSTSGGMNEWSAGYGGNYDNRFFFGASLNLVGLRYKQTKDYKETLMSNLNEPDIMTSMGFTETLKANGTGVNLRIGVNYVFNDVIRAGLSFKTPSVIGIRETYNASMSATYKPVYETSLPSSASKDLITQTNKYTLYTPYIVNGGIALFIAKKGFVTGEFEYIDHSTSEIGGSGGSKLNYFGANSNIKNNYTNVLNLKVGAELRLDQVRLRAGYAYQPSLYQSSVIDLDRRVRSSSADVYSFGIGYRNNEYFFDIAFNRTNYTSNYAPYLMPLKNPTDLKGSEPNISIQNKMNTITLGGGVFF